MNFFGLFKSKAKPNTCVDCIFMTSYQKINNRDVLIDINHCSMLCNDINAIKDGFLDNTINVSIKEPTKFSCSKFKMKIEK
jgi:hypothetical protein